MNKKVLYISYDGMTDPLGQSQVLPYLRELSGMGFRFTLISCEKPEKLAQLGSMIREICRQSGIEWHPLRYTKRPPVFSTIKDVVAIRKKAIALHRAHSFSLVHCRGYIPALTGLRLKLKMGVPFLFDMRGLWPDEKVDAGSWRLGNPVYKAVYSYFKKKEKQFFENADYTVSLTHAAQKEIYSWKHISNNPVRMAVIPCCVDLDLFDPAKPDPVLQDTIRRETGIKPEDTVLTYLGSIGSWYMLDEMLDFFLAYLDDYPHARFFFISGDQHDLIRQKAEDRSIPADRIIIRPAMRKEVPASISLGQHSVFFIRPTYSKISSSPTKQAELMAMGVPVISNGGVGDTAEIIKKYRSGVVTGDFSRNAYKEAIARLKDTPASPQEIRRGAFDYFSLKEGVKQYSEIYRQVIVNES